MSAKDASDGGEEFDDGTFSAPLGTGDDKVQGYNFRLCVTQDKDNKVPFPKPSAYNRSDWDLLFKYALEGPSAGPELGSFLNNIGPVPGGKFDMNNGGLFSTDCAGCSWGYPNSTYAERRVIYQRHVDYQQGFLWTLANDDAIPAPVRAALNRYGLCKDEFVSNDNWPEQLCEASPTGLSFSLAPRNRSHTCASHWHLRL